MKLFGKPLIIEEQGSFAAGGRVDDFMADEGIWGEDLSAYAGFCQAVLANIERIGGGEVLI